MSHSPANVLSGTDLGEDLLGTVWADAIFGKGGKDRLYGKGGDDELWGGEGDDLLDGGAGFDEMWGGAGSDTYRVDQAGDRVSEETVAGLDDGGNDTVQASLSWTLGRFLERLELRGSGDIDGAGNELANTLRGNAGANVLSGGGGIDTISGGDGNDTLIGGDGRDYLTGGAGADTFVISPVSSWADKIYDLAAEDRLGVYASAFGLSEGAGLTNGTLSAGWFVAGTAATAVGHGQFVYRADRATLYWDPDGVGGAAAVTVATFELGTTVTASQIVAMRTNAIVSVAAAETAPAGEDTGTAWAVVRLSAPLDTAVTITLGTAGGTATAGADYVALSGVQVTIPAGSTTVYVPIGLLDDTRAEGHETVVLHIDKAVTASGAPVAIGADGTLTIADEGPRLVADHSTKALGMTDPSAIAYDAATGTFFMADSEVEEAPFYRTNDFFSVTLGGDLVSARNLTFTAEATGLAIDNATGRLFITDDDKYRVFVVDRAKPGTVLYSFDTKALGGADPEDIAFDPDTGHLFIINGDTRTLIEVDQAGTKTYVSLLLPAEIMDPEALAYDPVEDVFYIGGGFSPYIWKVSRDGQILDTITILADARSSAGTSVAVKDLELAPASDGSGEMHLYVADYGSSHVDDGRLIEIDLGDRPSDPLITG